MRTGGVLLLVVFLVAGCGGGDPLGRKAISGKVTLGGSPVQQGSINFEPEGTGATTSSGAVIRDGQYAIEQEFGLPVGKYRVRINVPKPGTAAVEDTVTMPGEAAPPPVELAPPDWISKSTQSIEVTPDGPFTFDFEIPKKK